VALVRQTFHQIDNLEFNPSMPGDVRRPPSHLLLGREMPKKQEKRGFQIGGLCAKVFNTDTAVFQHTALSVYVADCGFSSWHSGESGHEIMWHGCGPWVTPISLSCLKQDHLEMRYFDWHTDFQ
jgi:hypothetical protein